MANEWDSYIRQMQSGGGATPQPPSTPGGLFGALFSGLLNKRQQSSGGLQPNKQGLWTPSIGTMPVGPATPINYRGIQSVLNSGVLSRPPNIPAPMPVDPEAANLDMPDPEKTKSTVLPKLLSALFGGG